MTVDGCLHEREQRLPGAADRQNVAGGRQAAGRQSETPCRPGGDGFSQLRYAEGRGVGAEVPEFTDQFFRHECRSRVLGLTDGECNRAQVRRRRYVLLELSELLKRVGLESRKIWIHSSIIKNVVRRWIGPCRFARTTEYSNDKEFERQSIRATKCSDDRV